MYFSRRSIRCSFRLNAISAYTWLFISFHTLTVPDHRLCVTRANLTCVRVNKFTLTLNVCSTAVELFFLALLELDCVISSYFMYRVHRAKLVQVCLSDCRWKEEKERRSVVKVSRGRR